MGEHMFDVGQLMCHMQKSDQAILVATDRWRASDIADLIFGVTSAVTGDAETLIQKGLRPWLELHQGSQPGWLQFCARSVLSDRALGADRNAPHPWPLVGSRSTM